MTLLLLPHRGRGRLSPCEIFPSYSHCVKPASNAPSLSLPSRSTFTNHWCTKRVAVAAMKVGSTISWENDMYQKNGLLFPWGGGGISRVLDIAVVVTGAGGEAIYWFLFYVQPTVVSSAHVA